MTTQRYQPDNVDRMLFRVVEETFAAEPWRASAPVVVINDVTGALSSWAVDRALNVRFVQDSAGLADAQAAVTGQVAPGPSVEVLAGASTVIYRLARPLEALEELAWHIARWAADDVMLLAGQLQRHLNFSLNAVLESAFVEVSASRGYYKARALRAQQPRQLTGDTPPRIPRKNVVSVASGRLELRAYGLTFGAARLDPGTQLLLETLAESGWDQLYPGKTVVDLGCGNGTIATAVAQATDGLHIIATDDSASAVQSTTATLAANGIEHVQVLHQSGLREISDQSVDVVILNPPFHDGTALTGDIARFLFSEAARVLQPDGVLYTVFNASRGYSSHLVQLVGPTEQLDRDKRFIVTRSQKVKTDV